MVSKTQIKQLAELVNDYWIAENPDVGDCSWRRGSYMLGNIAAYELTGKQLYLDYALDWADKNGWRFYNDAEYNTTNADYKICGQSYLKLMDIAADRGTDMHMLKSMEYTLNDSNNDYWWWVDTIYMALPFYHQMGVKYKDERYFDKAYKLFINSKDERTCYDHEEHLWYRDERFLPGKKREPNGEKMFWSRGNGWVFAGIARTLDALSKDNKYYAEYLTVFTQMAKRLKSLMHEDGYYTVSLLDSESFSTPETSGTALYTLGFLMGFRMGVLDDSYLQAGMKGYYWLTNTALEESGKIGYVQGVAWGPTFVEKDGSFDYAVGTYLLILKELDPLL